MSRRGWLLTVLVLGMVALIASPLFAQANLGSDRSTITNQLRTRSVQLYTVDLSSSNLSYVYGPTIDGTTLHSIWLDPKDSVATSGVNYHRLVTIGHLASETAYDEYGDITKPTYGLNLSFGRETHAATASFSGTDTGLAVYSVNKAVNNAAYNLQGAFIKAKNYSGGTVGTLKGLMVECVADGTETASYILDLSTDSSTVTADIRMHNGGLIDENTDGTLGLTFPIVKHAYGANDYESVTVADGGTVTHDITTDGTAEHIFADKVTILSPLKVKVDDAAYLNISVTDAGSVAFEETSDGTDGLVFKDPVTFCPDGGTAVESAGLLGGAGTGTGASAASLGSGGSNVKGLSFYTKTTSTTASHIQSGLYWNMDYGTSAASAAPSGDTIRGRAYLVGDAGTSSAVTGGAFTVELASTGASNTGLTAGGRNNIVLPDGVMTNSGTYYGDMAEVFLSGAACDTSAYTEIAPLGIVVGGTAPTAASQVSNMAAIAIRVPSNMVTSDATMVCTGGAADTCDAKMKISINGTSYWMMLSTDDE